MAHTTRRLPLPPPRRHGLRLRLQTPGTPQASPALLAQPQAYPCSRTRETTLNEPSGHRIATLQCALARIHARPAKSRIEVQGLLACISALPATNSFPLLARDTLNPRAPCGLGSLLTCFCPHTAASAKTQRRDRARAAPAAPSYLRRRRCEVNGKFGPERGRRRRERFTAAPPYVHFAVGRLRGRPNICNLLWRVRMLGDAAFISAGRRGVSQARGACQIVDRVIQASKQKLT